MTRPDISTLVDKNGVPYEIEGYISTEGYEEISKSKISSFSYLRDGWLNLNLVTAYR